MQHLIRMARNVHKLDPWDNDKNVIRMIGPQWTGQVPTRLNLETMEDEFYLHLDFTNVTGWFTKEFILSEWLRHVKIQNEKPTENNTILVDID